MSEAEAINRAESPRTVDSLTEDFQRLGITAGMTVLIHSSLSSLGWVCGGPVAVIQALLRVVTPEGTVVMPAHSSDLSEPGYWVNPPVPSEWLVAIRETMPAFDPTVTPTRSMGRIAENFRTWPGVRRSFHPKVSFAAWGRHADKIVNNHSLDFGFGEESPLARVYQLDGWVLLLGVGYDRNTSFHLAENRAPGAKLQENGAPIIENGRRVWRTYQEIETEEECLPEVGREFERTGAVKVGIVGSASARFFRQRTAVDFAQQWWTNRRNAPRG